MEQAKESFTYFYHLTHLVGTIGRRLEKWDQAKSICKNKGLFDENKGSYRFFLAKDRFCIIFFTKLQAFKGFTRKPVIIPTHKVYNKA